MDRRCEGRHAHGAVHALRAGACGANRRARVERRGGGERRGCTLLARLGSALLSSSCRTTSWWPLSAAMMSPVSPLCSSIRGTVRAGIEGVADECLGWEAD